MAPRKVCIACSLDPDTTMTVDVNLSQTLERLLPLFWRRFGIDSHVSFKGCFIKETMRGTLQNYNIIG
jgi:hypothetical protein